MKFKSMAVGIFLREHPRDATSWKLREMNDFIYKFSPSFAVSHMCAFGMKTSDEIGETYVYKPIKLMTNSWALANHLDKFKCGGGHRHVPLLSGRAAKAAIYPDKLCSAICKGIKEQLEYDQFIKRLDHSSVN